MDTYIVRLKVLSEKDPQLPKQDELMQDIFDDDDSNDEKDFEELFSKEDMGPLSDTDDLFKQYYAEFDVYEIYTANFYKNNYKLTTFSEYDHFVLTRGLRLLLFYFFFYAFRLLLFFFNFFKIHLLLLVFFEIQHTLRRYLPLKLRDFF